MKKLSAVALVATLVSASAFAGDHTINAIGRAGWDYKNNDTKKTSVPNSSSFSFDYLRTTFAGAVTPSVKYFLTADLLGVTGNDKVDGTPTLIDEAFVTKTFSFGTSLTVGKKAVLIGGREYDYANYDRYTLSSFYSATPANQVGATLSHEIAGQTITAQYFNGNKSRQLKDSSNNDINAQSKYGWSVGWNGNIANGLVKPIVAYTIVPQTKGDTLADAGTLLGTSGATRQNSGRNSYLSAGLQFNLPANFTVEADYDLLTQKDAELVSGAKKDAKLTSIVALVRYSTDRFAPFAKFITENRKTDSVKTAQRTAYDIGIEFKEAKDDMIRYQAVFSGSTVKTSMNTTEFKYSPYSILVGVKFDAAILK